MGMSNPIEEEEEEEAEEISTAKWVAGPGQGGAVAAVADKSNGALAGVAAAGPEGEAWFGAHGAGADAAAAAAAAGDLDAGMGDAFVAAGGALDGSDVQLEVDPWIIRILCLWQFRE